ncbi:MAG: hypothetical protein USCGTAYLOR_02152 [Chromatiales bacterium USCg_Taylor]|nr:MAG: hypothetical protein USCGTAYLOR_02152 [Chromatiales bacterium USCg_Taylor]
MLAAVLAGREAVWFKRHGALFAGFDRFGLLVGPLDIFLLVRSADRATEWISRLSPFRPPGLCAYLVFPGVRSSHWLRSSSFSRQSIAACRDHNVSIRLAGRARMGVYCAPGSGRRRIFVFRRSTESYHRVNDDRHACVPTQPRTILILKRQLPLIIQRLQRALDKLQAPEKADLTHVDVADWWYEATTRHGHNGVQFRATISTHAAIPADLYDSVIDNLLENAYVKRRAETGIEITVTLQSEVESVCLRVCDQGCAIATARANELFKQPVLSYSGLGI